MTTYGIIADIHGNLEALRAALTDLRRRGVSRIVCLGDIVGYNPEPNECVALVAAEGIDCIAGNHDLIALGKLGTDRCHYRPAHTLRRTRRQLDDASRKFLSGLPDHREYEGGIVAIHGGVDDVCEYMTSTTRVLENYVRFRSRYPGGKVCFFGHTHVQKVYEVHRGVVRELPVRQEVDLSGEDRVFFVNPGSVDASRRQGNKLAEFAVFDAAVGTVRFCGVPYDHRGVEARAWRQGYRMGPVEDWFRRTLYMLDRRGRWVWQAMGGALSRWWR